MKPIATGERVRIAFLHQALCWPGKAGSEKTLSKDKIPGAIMTLEPKGLRLEKEGSVCIVPHTNVINYIMETNDE